MGGGKDDRGAESSGSVGLSADSHATGLAPPLHPVFKVDPNWPKQLSHGCIFGSNGGVTWVATTMSGSDLVRGGSG
jgi:hypothetical protein